MKRSKNLTDAEWEERFARLVDPDYYAVLRRSQLGSALGGTDYGVPGPRLWGAAGEWGSWATARRRGVEPG